jgi:uncharacterized protein (DUF169 family)
LSSLKEIRESGKDLERMLLLKTAPIAVKVLRKEKDIPKNAIRPKRDRGVHLALCQAFTMSRRQGLTVALTREDHWCWSPPIAFGIVPPPDFYLDGRTVFPRMVASLDSARALAAEEPRLQAGKYEAIVSGPLGSTTFTPDVVLIYGNSSQVRTILLAVKYVDGIRVASTFDPLDSCVHSVVAAMISGQYRITFPDPGEYQRALATEDEIIFAVPKEKLLGLVTGLKHIEEMGHGYRAFSQEMRPDFPQPDFYKTLFKAMGIPE